MLPPALAVFLVLALLFGLLWLARRQGLAALSFRLAGSRTSGPAKQMRVIERVSLTAQHSLHLVSCSGKVLLVGVSPAGCNTLAEFAESSPESLSTLGGVQ